MHAQRRAAIHGKKRRSCNLQLKIARINIYKHGLDAQIFHKGREDCYAVNCRGLEKQERGENADCSNQRIELSVRKKLTLSALDQVWIEEQGKWRLKNELPFHSTTALENNRFLFNVSLRGGNTCVKENMIKEIDLYMPSKKPQINRCRNLKSSAQIRDSFLRKKSPLGLNSH
ncbi:unnamed protein product [Dovyalis caffra]|uniref:Uncharacterized protein n=1 Tax=Dovyalis caffra TaxID=77055 RepID=A0AAV1RWF8_9ROSI|nr:unnamed protein product [Dovyalis caffra]